MVALGVTRIVAKYTGLKSFYVSSTCFNTYLGSPYSNIRWKSSSTVVSPETKGVGTAQNNEPPQRDPLDLTFENTKIAYKSKTSWELLRGLFVMKLSSYKVLVENNEKLLKFGRRILGQRLFHHLMRSTFYGHFVAGESADGIQPTINRLYSFGVKPILDYSAEEDMSEEEAKEVEFSACISAAEMKQKELQTQDDLKQFRYHEKFADRRKYNVTARTYFYMSEAQCEKNTETFLRCIDAVAGTTKSTGFAAIKMTALGRPQLLIQLSEVIARTRKFFKDVTGAEKNIILSEVQPSLFEEKLQNDLQVNTHQKEVKDWLEKMDYDKKG